MVAPKPSAISVMPIISRKPSASMTMVGFFSMKLASGVGGEQHHRHRDDDGDVP
jgi:hypothetical protein